MIYEEVSLIFSGVVAISTVIYAILTWKLVSETKKMREVQTEPKLSIFIESNPKHHVLKDLVVQNIGLGPAHDVKFETHSDFKLITGKALDELKLIKNGIKYLSPNNRYQFLLANLYQNFKGKANHPFEIKVSYKNSLGKLYSDSFIIDFSIWEDLLYLDDKSNEEIVNQLKEINRTIERLNSSIEEFKSTSEEPKG